MLMGAYNGAIDHGIFVVGVCGEMLKVSVAASTGWI
jgi:hypothetical protein